jgi:hypothetical protein
VKGRSGGMLSLSAKDGGALRRTPEAYFVLGVSRVAAQPLCGSGSQRSSDSPKQRDERCRSRFPIVKPK